MSHPRPVTMQPPLPLAEQPDSYAAIIDENARREEARRLARYLAATWENTQPRHREQPETTSSPLIEPKYGRQIPAESEADAAPVPELVRSNTALIPEASPNDNPTPYRVAARVAQLKVFLKEEGDQFTAHIRSLEDVEEFEEAMELLHLDEERPDLSAGYPLTEDGFVAHCRVLFDAMKNLVDILDVLASSQPSYPYKRSGDSLAVKFVKSKKPIEINIVAGKLMRVIRKAQQGRLPTLGRDFREYGSFTLRFQAVANALRVSKLLVRSAFDSDEWIERIVINPEAELARKKMNKNNNEAKAEKHRFADRMKKNDPTINFKDDDSIKSTQASTSSATQSPAGQAQQQPSQGTDIPSPQAQMTSDPNPTQRSSKRVKTSHKQPDQPEESGPSLAYRINTSQGQQLSGGQATGPDRQSLQAPQDSGLDAASTESRLGNEALRRSTDERSRQRELGFASPGTPHAFATPRRGHGAPGNNGQGASSQGGTLALDPNPFNVPGPIQQYDLGFYSPGGRGNHRQATSGLARFRAIGGTRARIAKDRRSQQNQTEDLDHDD